MSIQKKTMGWLMRLINSRRSSKMPTLNIKVLYTSTENQESSAPIKSTDKIPKQVFQTWKTEYIDEGHFLNLKSFHEENRDYQFYFYNDKDMNEYMERAWGHHPISSVFRRTKVGAAKADIWRYCLLYDAGGIYLDIDASFKVPLSELIG